MDDRVLALCELSGDLLFHKIPKERLGYYIDQSLQAGFQAAQAFAGRPIRELYQAHNIGICTLSGGKKGYGVILRGQAVMSKTGCQVELYRDSLEALARYSHLDGVGLTQQQAVDIHLAHEFYHIWEYLQGSSIADRLEPIVSLEVLGFRRKSHIQKCEEVAAHAFAKAMVKLPCLPNLFDYAYLIGTGKMTPAAFEALTASMAQLLAGSESPPTPAGKEGDR